MASACSSKKTTEVGRSTVVTEDKRLSRTHEAPSLLVDRNDPDTVYLPEVELASWSEPRMRNDDPKGARIGQFYPKISLAPGGRIDVAWYDFRNDSFPAPTVAPTATAPFLASPPTWVCSTPST